ncbi:MAG TPA: addiction module protein [Blastocatellia bacterium]|nr:addiction module protein [Blastocatellia bacterium]
MDADLTKQVLSLSLPDRIALIDELWESILSQADEVPLTDAQRAELDRRLARHDANPGSARSWDDVRSRLWER